jgi:hypothetical protein
MSTAEDVDSALFEEAISILSEPGAPPPQPYDPGGHWCAISVKRILFHADHFRNHEAGKMMPRVIAGHVEESSFNAAAFMHPDRQRNEFFIAVNGGTSIVLEQLFCRFLSEPTLLAWIGDPIAESPGPRFPVRGDAQGIVDDFVNAGADPFDRFPKNPTRRRAAHFMSLLAMEYILQHELVHIQAGHVTFQPNITGKLVIRESYSKGVDVQQAMQLQAMEAEADCIAACRTLHAAFEFSEDPSSFLSDLFQSPDDSLFYVLFSIYCVWRIFGDSLPDQANWELLSHPPVRMRQQIISEMLHSVFTKKIVGKSHDRFGQQFIRAGSEAEYGFAIIQGTDAEMDGSLQVLSPASQAHMAKIKQAAREIEAGLARESYWRT